MSEPMELAGRGERMLLRAMEHAGTLPAKDSVKVRPADWHAMEAFVHEAAQALRALQAERDATVKNVRESALQALADQQQAEEAWAAQKVAEAALAEAVAERDRLRAAVEWALGEGDSDFGDNRPENAKPFWWRTELRHRARTNMETNRDAGC